MAIAHDAASTSASGTGNLSWTHTPTGTPRGVLVMIDTSLSAADGVTGVTYGGVTMARENFATIAGAQPASAHAYFLGSGIPTGAQTVAVTVTGAFDRTAVAVTQTAAADTEVDASNVLQATGQTNPSISVTTVAADTTVYAAASISNSTLSTAVTAPDIELAEAGNTTVCRSFARNSVNGTTGAVVIGWTFNNDTIAAVIVAIKESAGAPAADVMPDVVMAPRIPAY